MCRDVQVNFAYRWFCGISIEDKIPDHSAFSRARHERFRDSDIWRRVFERVVKACIAAGLVSGEGVSVDASLIGADANKQRSIPGKDWDKNRDPETAGCAIKGVSRSGSSNSPPRVAPRIKLNRAPAQLVLLNP